MPYRVPTYRYNTRRDIEYIGDVALCHLYHLTTIQVLKELNLDDIDNDVSWQYGQYYNTPWKDCHHAAADFRSYHLPVLYAYTIDKCLCSLCETAKYLVNIFQVNTTTAAKLIDSFNKHLIDDTALASALNTARNRNIQMLGVTPAIADQVDVILQTGKLMKNANKAHGRVINDRFVGNLKQVCSQIEMLDKMCILSFNTKANEHIVISGEESYLRQDQICDLLELVSTLVTPTHMTASAIAQRDMHFDSIRIMTYICSMLLHLFHEKETLPEREEDLFKEKIENATSDASPLAVFPRIREFTDKSLAYILRMPFHIFASGYCPNHPERRNAVRPYSLQERYLYLWYMLNISRNINPSTADRA